MDIKIEIIEKIWGLRNVVCEKVFSGDNERMIALISSDKGKFVYKLTSPWKDASALEKDTAVFDILNSLGKPYISKIFKTVEGKNFANIGDRFVCLFEYIEGENPKPTAETYRKLGTITADLHSVSDYPHKTDFDPNYIAEHNFIENAKGFSFANEYLSIARTLPSFSKFSQTLIHTDISHGNSIEKDDGSLVLIDWDDNGVGPVVLDLGYVLGQCISEDLEINKDMAAAFFHAYLQKKTIDPEDRKGIFDGCLFFHLMYIIHGDVPKRWNKIQWLIKNREAVESLIP